MHYVYLNHRLHAVHGVQQRCADCGRVRLRTQIRRNYRIRGLTADECFCEHCGRGLTRIIIPQHEMDATHEPIAAWTGNAAASV